MTRPVPVVSAERGPGPREGCNSKNLTQERKLTSVATIMDPVRFDIPVDAYKDVSPSATWAYGWSFGVSTGGLVHWFQPTRPRQNRGTRRHTKAIMVET
jgi:hypothetical protein